jgi:hypothetical protein
MTDINGVPIINGEEPVQVIKPAVAIAEVPIELRREQNIIEMKLKAPGIVRAMGFWLQTPSVLGSVSMREVEKVAQPLLFVECDPNGALFERVFLFQPSNAPFVPRPGWLVQYRATAIGQTGALHVFEIVQAPS